MNEDDEVRLHEALGMLTPSSLHKYSKRNYPEKPSVYDYPKGYKKLRVTRNGAIRWGAYNWVYISRGAKKRYIGVKEIGAEI